MEKLCRFGARPVNDFVSKNGNTKPSHFDFPFIFNQPLSPFYTLPSSLFFPNPLVFWTKAVYSLSTRELLELLGSGKRIAEGETGVGDWLWDCQTQTSLAFSGFSSRCCSRFDEFTITFMSSLFAFLMSSTDWICFVFCIVRVRAMSLESRSIDKQRFGQEGITRERV